MGALASLEAGDEPLDHTAVGLLEAFFLRLIAQAGLRLIAQAGDFRKEGDAVDNFTVGLIPLGESVGHLRVPIVDHPVGATVVIGDLIRRQM